MTKHGMYGTPTYTAWAHMIQRCYNPKVERYPSYGGRGIKVVEEWKTFNGFFKDMGLKPEGMSLDRIDVNGDYCKENCRWATSSEQQRNKRNVPLITFNGKSQSVKGWAEDYNIDVRTLHKRLTYLKWPIERALGLVSKDTN